MNKTIFRIILCCVLLASFLIPMVSVGKVQASATLTLRPNAAGDETSIGYQSPSSGSHWDKVDDAVADDSSTYVYSITGSDQRDLYNLPNHTTENGTISSITIYIRCAGSAGYQVASPSFKIGSVVDGTGIGFDTSFTTSSQQWNINPVSGVAWTWTDIDNLQIGVSLVSAEGYVIYCTQVAVVIDYSPPPTTPTVTTSAASSVAGSTATLNGNVTATGNKNPTVTVYWGTSDGGTNFASWSNNSSPTSPTQPQGVAAFYKNATSLSPKTLYYFSASANNSAGTSWGTSQNFTTGANPSTVTSQAVSSIAATTATGSGNITNTGGENADIRGVCWNTTGTPTVSDSKSQETGSFGVATFSESMTGLVHSTFYYVRAYAHNSAGYSYGNQVTFTSADTIPTLTTLAASSVNSTFAAGSGNITELGRSANATQWGVQWGTITGVYTTNTTQSGSRGLGSFSANMTPLLAGTTYYFRAMAYNAQGWGYGNQMSFTTVPTTPATVVTADASEINTNYATLAGTLIDLGSSTSIGVSFEYGTTSSYGSTTPESQMTATTIGGFTSQITGLSYSTVYHYRARARYGLSYSYGADVTFTTLPAAGSSTDLRIRTARIFNNYMAPDNGDMLLVVEAQNTYTGKYPGEKAGDYFTIQLLATNNIDILGASPLSDWGDRPSSIYFNPTVAANLTQGAAYWVKMIGNSATGNVSVEYQLQISDWEGYDLTGLDSWCIGTAKNMANSDSVAESTYVVHPTDIHAVINDAAGGYFTVGIPGIGQIRPHLFNTTQYKPTIVAGTANNFWDKTDADPAGWRSYVGANLAADIDAMSLPFGITGKDFMGGIVMILMLGCVMVVVGGTGGFGALGAVLIALPILWLGTYFRIVPIITIMLMVIFFGLFTIRQFVVKTL